MADPTGGSVSIDEMDQANSAATPPDLSSIKLEGDGIPEHLRGKSVAESLQMLNGMQEALRVSETARNQAEQIAKLAASRVEPAPAPQRVVEEPKELTDEQLAQLHQENPLAAIQYMNDRAVRMALKNVEERVGPLFNSAASQVESQMRQKYPIEFELFGEEISKFAASLPNKQAVLGNPAAWEDMISLVRGRSGNLDRYIERKSGQGTPAQRRAEAMAAQAADVGFQATGGSEGRTGRLNSVTQMDSVQKEIADKLGLTHEEYVKWFNAGARG